MDKKVVYGLIQRLNLTPIAGSKLAVFLSRLDNQSVEVDDPGVSVDQDKDTSIDNSDQEIINWLKRMQIITLTRPILELSIRAQTPLELNKAKSAGVESLIYIPDQISRKLNSFETALKSSIKDFTEIKETSAEELNKKFNLVVPPNGLEISVVLTLVVAAFTILAFVILKSEDMLGSPEAYWGFFGAGILTLLGINAIIINLIKLLRFKKNRDLIIIEAKRIFVENKHLKHSRFKKKIEDESFQIQKREYSQAAELKLKEIGREEQSIRESLNA
jgi:hypothetical protein